jgi:hypothetical protein
VLLARRDLEQELAVLVVEVLVDLARVGQLVEVGRRRDQGEAAAFVAALLVGDDAGVGERLGDRDRHLHLHADLVGDLLGLGQDAVAQLGVVHQRLVLDAEPAHQRHVDEVHVVHAALAEEPDHSRHLVDVAAHQHAGHRQLRRLAVARQLALVDQVEPAQEDLPLRRRADLLERLLRHAVAADRQQRHLHVDDLVHDGLGHRQRVGAEVEPRHLVLAAQLQRARQVGRHQWLGARRQHDVVRAREQLVGDLLQQFATHRDRALDELRVGEVAHDAAQLAARDHVDLHAEEAAFTDDRHGARIHATPHAGGARRAIVPPRSARAGAAGPFAPCDGPADGRGRAAGRHARRPPRPRRDPRVLVVRKPTPP